MTTLAELVELEPDPTYGYPIQLVAVSGEWRWAVELADTTAGTYVEWIDITEWYVGDRHQFGADQYMGDARARVVTVQLQIDESDLLAPWGLDTTELFGEDVELDAGLLMRAGLFRVVSAATVEWHPIWTGRVEQWGDASYARGQVRVHEVQVVDTIADLANVPTSIVSNAEPWDEVIVDEVLAGADWQFGADIYGDGGTGGPGIPQDLDMVAAANRMDQITDPLGLVWRSLRSGRLVVHPAPWDTTHTERYDNPLLVVYPDGLMFSYSPEFTDIEYIADDGQVPFGVQRTVAGVLNSFIVTSGTLVYAVDDPVSISKYGVRPFTASWILDNDPVVDDLLTARAFASVQALPLRTTIDHEGFFPALAMVDHLDPVTVEHAAADGRPVVTVVGTIRNIVEERTFRHITGDGDATLNWQSTVQIDVASTTTAEALLPVEDLALVSAFTPGFGGPSGAEFSWTNPTQPTVTPTEVEVRIVERSLIWQASDYPGVGADGVTMNWLAAATAYTFQVRLVRRVDGVATHVSPIRELVFVTPANILPVIVPGGDDDTSNGEIPVDLDPECELEVELQEQEDIGGVWVTVDTYTDAELVDNGDGTWSLASDIENYDFNEGSMYRLRWREVCDGTPGDWTNGTPQDPPDDWTNPCVTPPALATPPYDDASLFVYVPQICAPDIIREAVSGIEGVHGDALAQIGSLLGDDPSQRALKAIADPDWSDTPGGILAYGECPQAVGKTGDKTISVRVNVADDVSCVLFECAAMRITCTGVSGQWRPGVTVYKVGSTVSLAGVSLLDLDTTYTITATHDFATGDIKIYIDGVQDNSVGGTDNIATINALPIWRVGAPPESWITDCAVWDTVLDVEIGLENAVHWWDFSNAGSRVDSGANVSTITDLINGAVMTASGTVAKSTLGGNGLTSAICSPSGAALARMTTSGMLLANLPVWVSWVGCLPGGSPAGVYVWNSGTGGSAHAVGGAATQYIAVSTTLTDSALTTATPTVFYAEFNGASSKLYVNGTLSVSGNTGTASALSGDGALFNSFAGGNGGSIHLGEVKWGTGTNDDAAITVEYNRLVDKWDV